MRNIFFALLFLPLLCAGQSGAIQKTIGFTYTAGVPTFIPSPVAKSSEIAQDTTTKDIYFWNRYTQTWDKQGRGYDEIPGALAPLYTPTYTDSKLVINAANELYRWRSGVTWDCINCVATIVTTARLSGNGSAGSPLDIAQQGASSGQVLKWSGSTWQPGTDNNTTYTAGSGISINGSNVIANTSPDQTVVITGATGTYPNFTLPDQSATNELNTGFDISGGNLRVIDAGATRTVALTSIAPVQAVSAGTGISIAGTSTRTITNTAPDQTVTIAGAGINAVTGTYPNFTVTGTEVDGSNTNEIQTLALSGTSVTLSPGGGSFDLPIVDVVAGTGISVAKAGGAATVTNTGDTNASDDITGSGTANQLAYFTAAKVIGSAAALAFTPASGAMQIGSPTNSGAFLEVKTSNNTSGTFALRIANSDNATILSLANDASALFRVPKFVTYNTGSGGDPAIATSGAISGLFEPAYGLLGFSSFAGEAARFFGNASRQFGIGVTTGTGKLMVKGNGATSSTHSLILQNSSGIAKFSFRDDGAFIPDATITPTGTTGAQTINKLAGTVNFAAGATSLTVTNSLCSTTSIIWAGIRTNDATATIKNVVPASGSFTITLTAAATAETSVGFLIIN